MGRSALQGTGSQMTGMTIGWVVAELFGPEEPAAPVTMKTLAGKPCCWTYACRHCGLCIDIHIRDGKPQWPGNLISQGTAGYSCMKCAMAGPRPPPKPAAEQRKDELCSAAKSEYLAARNQTSGGGASAGTANDRPQ